MSDTAKPRFEPCAICDNTGWVCEGHGNHPWRGVSNRPDSCDFGPGMPCPSSACEHSLARREDDDNTRLRAENERLRAALHSVVHGWEVPQDGNWNRVFRSVWGKARAALDGQPAPGKEGA